MPRRQGPPPVLLPTAYGGQPSSLTTVLSAVHAMGAVWYLALVPGRPLGGEGGARMRLEPTGEEGERERRRACAWQRRMLCDTARTGEEDGSRNPIFRIPQRHCPVLYSVRKYVSIHSTTCAGAGMCKVQRCTGHSLAAKAAKKKAANGSSTGPVSPDCQSQPAPFAAVLALLLETWAAARC